MLRLPLLLSLLLTAAVTASCAGRACEEELPTLLVTLELSPAVSGEEIASLRAEVSAAGLTKAEQLDTGPLRANHRASFVVLVGDAGAGGFTALVSARAISASGALLAWAGDSFQASGNACNAFTLQLAPPSADGGLPDLAPSDGGADSSGSCGPASCSGCCLPGGECAAGTSDTQCGVGGDPCVDCSADQGSCQQGSCLGVLYSWKTSAWSSCSRSCDGGIQTRSVWCERSDGERASDELCSGAKPALSQSCNPQPCCTTASLADGRACTGDERAQWTTWGSNSGSLADRGSCAEQCTDWAEDNSFTQWCCQLYEDSASGTNWVCRVYDSYSTAISSGRYAGLGQCQAP